MQLANPVHRGKPGEHHKKRGEFRRGDGKRGYLLFRDTTAKISMTRGEKDRRFTADNTGT